MFQQKSNKKRLFWEIRPRKSNFPVRRFNGVYFFLFYISQTALFAQNSIDDALTKLDKANPTEKIKFIPLKSELPALFSGSPINGYIGISDPGADSATAYDQAYLRAVSMYNLSNGIGRGVSDYYTHSDDGEIFNNYEEMCELNANSTLSASAIKISDPIRLQTGEVILLLTVDKKLGKSNDLLELKSKISLYVKETGRDNKMKSQTKSILENSCNPVQKTGGHQEQLNNVSIDNRWINRETRFDNTYIDNLIYKTFYFSDNRCSNVQTESESRAQGDTYEGLWYAFINSTFRQLALQLKQQFQKEKSLGENYVRMQNNLSREAGYVRFQCLVNTLFFCENHLYVDMTTTFPSTK